MPPHSARSDRISHSWRLGRDSRTSHLVDLSPVISVMAYFLGDDPYGMINWRSLLLEVKPDITDRSGVLLTYDLRRHDCRVRPMGLAEAGGRILMSLLSNLR